MINPNHPGDGHLAEDGDVQEESRRVNETPVEILCQNNAIVLKNLRKIFCVKFSLSPFVAVHNSSLALPQNECLGLLGQNGAGKTTTFKMLTGDHMVSSGDAYVKGLSVKTQIKTIQAMMGYCPQQDALHERLTGRETLYLYARLRGVPETSLHNVTEAIVDFVTLRPHEDKLTGKYSGGNKRKLSVGISIIGDPLFIMLDEPTAGMDPVAKRTLWTVLHLIRSSGRTLVLTSHSMEECEALCTRIAIMAKGRILCLGSPQHLKNKYGQGYTVVIRASVDEHGKVLKLDEAHKFVVHALQKSQVFATQEAYVHLQVSDSVPLSILFSTLEQAKQKYKFQFYTVQQTTLEQVFLMFMKETFV
ncbi:unnamed protein product [Lymnaea stagnalis]|uniref:ABC transporter domain-containing protein n=1 Tax=Lymnaea stagnalis TaxID=6523 RepID=A0AAV2IUF2_LYMST